MTDTTSTRPQMGDEELPATLEGQWETPEGFQMAREYLSRHRGRLCWGDLTDMEAAHKIAMLSRNDAEFEPTLSMAKDRIRYLSVQLALANARASFPQPTAGSTGASKLPEWHLKEREELLVKMDAMTGFWEVAAARELHRLYLIEDECASTPAQSGLVEDDYVLLPKTLTVEIACALEMAAPPPATSQAAAEQLVADYAMIWSHVVALSHAPSQSQPKRASEIAYARKCWTDEIKNSCRDRCGEFGEPACFEIVEWATPCLDCSPRASQPERMSMAGLEIRNAANEVLTNGEWTDGEQRGDWKISKEVYETLRDALAASPPVQPIAGEE